MTSLRPTTMPSLTPFLWCLLYDIFFKKILGHGLPDKLRTQYMHATADIMHAAHTFESGLHDFGLYIYIYIYIYEFFYIYIYIWIYISAIAKLHITET